jgi:HEAT repeat protein
LIVHDVDGPSPAFSKSDIAILRQVAQQGVLANHVPALRRNAMLALAESPSSESIGLLTELALVGEDFYTRGHAMLALGQIGWTIVAPLLRNGLRAEELFERNAAEAGLLSIARKNGPSVLRAILETEKDKGTRVALQRILGRLEKQRPPGKLKKHISSKRRG